MSAPICAVCLAAIHAGGEPDFPYRPALQGETCAAADHVDNVWRDLDARLLGLANGKPTLTVDDVVEAAASLHPSPGASFLGDRVIERLGTLVDRRAAVGVILRAARDMGAALASLERVLRFDGGSV
jgi:hypothetical protein